MVEVIVNGVSIDLISDGVEYTKQANDLADISTVNSSFTYSLKADKTPKNTQLFQQLGMVGDTSQTPYVKNTAQLLDNGSMLIERGLMTVVETNNEYKVKIQDGIVEVFKLIENRTVGNDLNIDELEHDKSAASIIDTWNTEKPYKYLIADYNGKTNEGSQINAAYQIPSVSVKYLWDKIFDYLGWTYSGDFNFIKNKYITYPKPPGIAETDPILVGLARNTNGYSGDFNDTYKSWSSIYTDAEIQIIDNWKFKVLKTGSLNVVYEIFGDMDLVVLLPGIFTSASGTFPFRVNLLVDGQVVDSSVSGETKQWDSVVQAGSIVEIEAAYLEAEDFENGGVVADSDIDTKVKNAYLAGWITETKLIINRTGLSLTSIGFQDIDFREALSNFSLKDFFKEVLFRGALTPFTDSIKRHIHFDSLNQRFNFNDTEDISQFFVRRVNEYYEFGDYAQRNHLKLKYNNEEESYNDSFISVQNKNIKDEKDLFQSKFYTADFEPANLLFNTDARTPAPVLRMWKKEIKETDQGNEVEYKELKNRFYYIAQERVDEFISISGSTNPFFYKASVQGTTMKEVVSSKYNSIDRIFTDTKIHEIELALSAYHFKTMDLQTLKYVKQENQFYILNKIKWKTGRISVGEFLRVKKL